MEILTKFTPSFRLVLFLLALPVLGLAQQFPVNNQKIVQGVGTTAQGISSYSSSPPTTNPSASTWRHVTSLHMDTVLQVQYIYKRPRWYPISVVRRATPPPATASSGSTTIDYTESLWQSTADSLTYYYEEENACWQPIGTYLSSTTPVDVAATGSTGAICYGYGLWYDPDIDSIYAQQGATWTAIGAGGGTSGAVDSIVVLQDSIIVGYSEGSEVTRDTIGYPAVTPQDSTAVRVSDVANVKIYGALGNGSDATTAFQNAIASGKTVYVPPGRYLITTALTLQDGQTIYGDGDNSVVKITANISAFILVTRATIRDIRIVGDLGGADTAQRGVFMDGGAGFNAAYENYITGLFLDSLGGAGIYATRIGVATGTGLAPGIISMCIISRCAVGINLDTRAEYLPVIGVQINSCTTGIIITGGNCNVSNCVLTFCITAIAVFSGSNSDHGTVSDCTINHNTTGIVISGATLGMIFSHNQIWTNTTAVSLTNCANMYFNGGTIANGTISASNATNCFFTNIQFSGTVTKSVGSNAVFFIDNYEGTTKGVYPTVAGDFVLRMDGINTHTYAALELPDQTATTIQLDGTDVITTSKNNKIFRLLADSVSTSNLSFTGAVVGEYLLHISGITDSIVFQFASPPNGPSGNLLDSVIVYYDGVYEMYYDGAYYTINIPGNEYVLPFSPDDISGLKLWLDASDATTIATGVNGVTLWEDKSGSSNDFSATSTTCPDVVTAGKNGLDVIDFNNEFMQLAATTNRDSFRFLHATTSTVFFVIKPSTSASPEANYDFLANKNLGSGGRGYLLGYADAGALEDRFVGQISNGTQQVVLNYDNNKIDPDDFNVIIYTTDVAAATALRGLYYIDAGAVNATNTQTNTASASDAGDNLYLGQNSGNANRMAGGQICEILIYNSVLSTVNRELIRDYLNTKWAVY